MSKAYAININDKSEVLELSSLTAETVLNEILEKNKESKRLRTAYCTEAQIDGNLPWLLNKAGIFTAVIDSEDYPIGGFYLKGKCISQLLVYNIFGLKSEDAALKLSEKSGCPAAFAVEDEKSLQAYTMREEETGEKTAATREEFFRELCGALPCFTSVSVGEKEYDGYEKSDFGKKAAEALSSVSGKKISADGLRLSDYIYINKENVHIDALKLCADGSGDLIIRVHETGAGETSCCIIIDALDAGFTFEIEKDDMKIFRIDKNTAKVRDIGFDEGILPHEDYNQLC